MPCESKPESPRFGSFLSRQHSRGWFWQRNTSGTEGLLLLPQIIVKTSFIRGLSQQSKQRLLKDKAEEILFCPVSLPLPTGTPAFKKLKAQTHAVKELPFSLCSGVNTYLNTQILYWCQKLASLIPGECLLSLGGNSISGSWELANMYPEYLNAIMRRNRWCHPSWPSIETPFFLLSPFVSFSSFFFSVCEYVRVCNYTPG